MPKKEYKEELVGLVDLIYGDKDKYGRFKSLNGIGAEDNYVMAGMYYEADLDNLFFRKESGFDSYKPPGYGLKKIETQNIPVFSFRYKTLFSKSEEIEFERTYKVKSVYA